MNQTRRSFSTFGLTGAATILFSIVAHAAPKGSEIVSEPAARPIGVLDEKTRIAPLLQLGEAIGALLPGDVDASILPSGLITCRASLLEEPLQANEKLAVIAARAKEASGGSQHSDTTTPRPASPAQEALARVSRAMEGLSARTLRSMPVEELSKVAEGLLVELQGGAVGKPLPELALPDSIEAAALVSGWSGPRLPKSISRHSEIQKEVALDPSRRMQAPDHFYSFEEYMENVLHHPRWGYYTSGRVAFGADGDFNTYPIGASPYFGQAVAEHAFLMWKGMLEHGSLGPEEAFEVVEIGGGDGQLAHDFLAHARSKAGDDDPERKAFFSQVRYTIYERSPALRERQRANNAEFGDLFRSEMADARELSRDPGRAIKGLVLSNELVDAFGVHKVLIGPDGSAEAAFVMPSITDETLDDLRIAGSPSSLIRRIQDSGRALRDRFALGSRSVIYLDKEAFGQVMDFIASLSDDVRREMLLKLRFEETYLPAAAVPALAEHFKAHAGDYADALVDAADHWGDDSRRFLAFVNTAADRYMEGIAHMLRSGYAMTIDYGQTIAKLIDRDMGHLRTYERRTAGHDAFLTPTLIDMTADVDFTALASAGERWGLRGIFFGSQGILGDIIDVSRVYEALHPVIDSKLRGWLGGLVHKSAFYVLIQQKDGTDPRYVFSNKPSSVLDRRRRAQPIEARLRGAKGAEFSSP